MGFGGSMRLVASESRLPLGGYPTAKIHSTDSVAAVARTKAPSRSATESLIVV